MGEYSWYVRKEIIGVMCNGNLVGTIRRSGRVRAHGHFCYVRVEYQGHEFWASGAEDRIFPFHSIRLEKYVLPRKLEKFALGWCRDGSTYAYVPTTELEKGWDGRAYTLRGIEIPQDSWREWPVMKILQKYHNTKVWHTKLADYYWSKK